MTTGFLSVSFWVDGPAAAWSGADVVFYPSPTSDTRLWSQTASWVVDDGPGRVLVGLHSVPAQLFSFGPRFAALCGTDGQRPVARVAVDGALLRLAARVAAIEARLERWVTLLAPDSLRDEVRVVQRVADEHEHRLAQLESGDGARAVSDSLLRLDERLGALDGPGGRLERVEDQWGDVAGGEGELFDHAERILALEQRVRDLLAATAPSRAGG